MDVGDIHGFHVFLKTEFDRLHSFARSYRAEQDDDKEDPVPLSSTLATVSPVTDMMNAFLEQLGKQNPEYKTRVKEIIDEYLTKEKEVKLAELKTGESLEKILKEGSEEADLLKGLQVFFQKEEEAVKDIKQKQKNLEQDGIVKFFKQHPRVLADLMETIEEIPMKDRQQIVKEVSDENPNAPSGAVAQNSLVRLVQFALGKLKNPMTYILLASMILMCSIWFGILTQDPVDLAKENLNTVIGGKLPPEASDTTAVTVKDVAKNLFSVSKHAVFAALWKSGPLITDSFPVKNIEFQVTNPLENTELVNVTNLTKAIGVEAAEILGLSADDVFKNQIPVTARGMFKSLQKYRDLREKYEKTKAAIKRAAEATTTVKRVGMEAMLDGFVDVAWDIADAPKAAAKVASKGIIKGGIKLLKKTGGYFMSSLIKKKVGIAIAADAASAAVGYVADKEIIKAKNEYATRMNVGIALMVDRWLASFIVGCLLKASAWIADQTEYYKFAMTLKATDKALFYYSAANIFFMSFVLSAAEVSANAGATFLGDYTGLDFLSDLAPGQSIALLVLNTITGVLVVGDLKDTAMSAVGATISAAGSTVDCIRKAWSNRPTADTIKGAIENPKKGKVSVKHNHRKFIEDKMKALWEKFSSSNPSAKTDQPSAFPGGIMPTDVFATYALKF